MEDISLFHIILSSVLKYSCAFLIGQYLKDIADNFLKVHSFSLVNFLRTCCNLNAFFLSNLPLCHSWHFGIG